MSFTGLPLSRNPRLTSNAIERMPIGVLYSSITVSPLSSAADGIKIGRLIRPKVRMIDRQILLELSGGPRVELPG